MNIKTELEKLPIEIKEERKALLEDTATMEQLALDIKKWEVVQMAGISAELDDKGKLLYSNAEKRQVEMELRKAADQEIIDLECNYKRIKQEIDISRIRLQYQIDVQENLRAIARLGGSE